MIDIPPSKEPTNRKSAAEKNFSYRNRKNPALSMKFGTCGLPPSQEFHEITRGAHGALSPSCPLPARNRSHAPKRKACRLRELRLADLALLQVLPIVGLPWIGYAAKLGGAQVWLWLAAIPLPNRTFRATLGPAIRSPDNQANRTRRLRRTYSQAGAIHPSAHPAGALDHARIGRFSVGRGNTQDIVRLASSQ